MLLLKDLIPSFVFREVGTSFEINNKTAYIDIFSLNVKEYADKIYEYSFSTYSLPLMVNPESFIPLMSLTQTVDASDNFILSKVSITSRFKMLNDKKRIEVPFAIIDDSVSKYLYSNKYIKGVNVTKALFLEIPIKSFEIAYEVSPSITRVNNGFDIFYTTVNKKATISIANIYNDKLDKYVNDHKHDDTQYREYSTDETTSSYAIPYAFLANNLYVEMNTYGNTTI